MTGSMRAALYCAALAAVAAVALAPSGTAAQPAAMGADPNTPGNSANPSIAHGAIVYVFFCAECHGAIGQGDETTGAPQLAGRPAHDLAQNLAQLAAARSKAGRPDHARLLAKLTSQDIDGIADYLASLAPPPSVATH